MVEIIFDQLIPMPAVTWKRPRLTLRQDPTGKLTAQGWNEKKYTQAKAQLGWEIKAAAPKLRCSNKDRFGFRCSFMLVGGIGGDGDRYENLVMDALQGIVWENDNQVDEGAWTKSYNAANPGIWLTIWRRT